MNKDTLLEHYAQCIEQGEYQTITFRERDGQQNISIHMGANFYIFVNEDDTVHLHVSAEEFPIRYAEFVRMLHGKKKLRGHGLSEGYPRWLRFIRWLSSMLRLGRTPKPETLNTQL